MCESYNEDWASILKRHEKFHNAMQTVRVEQLWSKPAEWQQAVIAARYRQSLVAYDVETVTPKGEQL